MTRRVRVRLAAVVRLSETLPAPRVKDIVLRNLRKNGIDTDQPFDEVQSTDGRWLVFYQQKVAT